MWTCLAALAAACLLGLCCFAWRHWPRGTAVAALAAWERTFAIARRTSWQQFFLSGSASSAAGSWHNARRWQTWDETSWTYDRATGLKISKTYADDSQVQYTYTDDGRPVRTTWARGAWRENSYDSQRGLLVGTAYSDSSTPAVACTRNAAGLLSAVQIGNAYACGYTYDEYLKCTEEALTNDYQSTSQYTFTLMRSYDSSLRPYMTAVWHGAGTFSHNQREYDLEGRLCGHVLTSGTQLSTGGPNTLAVAVTHAGSHPAAYAYTFPNGSTLGLAIAREPGRIGWVTGRTYTMGETTVYGYVGNPKIHSSEVKP